MYCMSKINSLFSPLLFLHHTHRVAFKALNTIHATYPLKETKKEEEEENTPTFSAEMEKHNITKQALQHFERFAL